MSIITSVQGRIVFNSRGSRSIEVDVITNDKHLGRACAPSGASVGSHEAISFVNNQAELSLQVLNSHKKKFLGIDARDPMAVFDILKSIDSSPTYEKIGGAVAYALSIAAIDAASKSEKVPMFKLLKPRGPYKFPFPLGNVLGGGSHAGPGTPDIQEILVCPVGARNIVEALEMNFRLHSEVKNAIEQIDKKFTYGRGDEGAWAPNLHNDEALAVVAKAIDKTGFRSGKDIGMGIDFASSSLWDEASKSYDYRRQGLSRDTEEQINFVTDLIEKYNLVYVEDPVNEDDFESMAKITKSKPKCIVAGDDMLVTNAGRIGDASKYGACSGAILKVNQAGSLHEALNFAEECKMHEIKIITSHRSGESVDSHISHIAVATASKMIKTGVLGGERIAKLNEFVRMSEYDLIEGLVELSIT
ncbi:MAG: enolase [Thermoproteota archaeon]|nr:enolase [Thermoproteota archaeon]